MFGCYDQFDQMGPVPEERFRHAGRILFSFKPSMIPITNRALSSVPSGLTEAVSGPIFPGLGAGIVQGRISFLGTLPGCGFVSRECFVSRTRLGSVLPV